MTTNKDYIIHAKLNILYYNTKTLLSILYNAMQHYNTLYNNYKIVNYITNILYTK